MARNKREEFDELLDEDDEEISDLLKDNVRVYDEFEEEDDEIEELLTPKKKKRKKTLKEKLRYRGKHELLPERENWKQIRFYQRLFTLRYAGLVTALVALAFAVATIKVNHLFSLVVIFTVLAGAFYGVFGLLKIRGWRFFLVATSLALNLIALIMVIRPFLSVAGSIPQIVQIISDYFTNFAL